MEGSSSTARHHQAMESSSEASLPQRAQVIVPQFATGSQGLEGLTLPAVALEPMARDEAQSRPEAVVEGGNVPEGSAWRPASQMPPLIGSGPNVVPPGFQGEPIADMKVDLERAQHRIRVLEEQCGSLLEASRNLAQVKLTPDNRVAMEPLVNQVRRAEVIRISNGHKMRDLKAQRRALVDHAVTVENQLEDHKAELAMLKEIAPPAGDVAALYHMRSEMAAGVAREKDTERRAAVAEAQNDSLKQTVYLLNMRIRHVEGMYAERTGEPVDAFTLASVGMMNRPAPQQGEEGGDRMEVERGAKRMRGE